jgi:hypothetical protein
MQGNQQDDTEAERRAMRSLELQRLPKKAIKVVALDGILLSVVGLCHPEFRPPSLVVLGIVGALIVIYAYHSDSHWWGATTFDWFEHRPTYRTLTCLLLLHAIMVASLAVLTTSR